MLVNAAGVRGGDDAALASHQDGASNTYSTYARPSPQERLLAAGPALGLDRVFDRLGTRARRARDALRVGAAAAAQGARDQRDLGGALHGERDGGIHLKHKSLSIVINAFFDKI